MTNRKVMIYSVILSGHRQLYCDVLTDVFLELGYDILLVVGLSQQGTMPYWKHIERYRNHARVSIVDTYKFDPNHGRLTVDQIVQIQKQNSISVTIYPCGDEMRNEFSYIANGRKEKLVGVNLGVFGWLDGWFPMDNPYHSGLLLKERMRILRSMLFTNNIDSAFFERVLRPGKVLDVVFLKDERAAALKGPPFYWIPEIFRPWDWQHDREDIDEYDQIIPAYQKFLSNHVSSEVLLYFGQASRYKGYDIMLRLALEDKRTCFVLCGIQNDSDKYDYDVKMFRDKLIKENRFFETNRRIAGWKTVDYFFDSIKNYVSTHRLYGSSGTALQASLANKPVLVPARGTLEYRVLQNNLGRTYNPNDFWDLIRQWNLLKSDSRSEYVKAAPRFMKRFSKGELLNTFANVLGS